MTRYKNALQAVINTRSGPGRGYPWERVGDTDVAEAGDAEKMVVAGDADAVGDGEEREGQQRPPGAWTAR